MLRVAVGCSDPGRLLKATKASQMPSPKEPCRCNYGACVALKGVPISIVYIS